MSAEPLVTELLTAPLGPDWTIEALAERLLAALVTLPVRGGDGTPEIVLDMATITDRQSLRLLRPLVACLATQSAAEAGILVNLYTGRLAFRRPGPSGPVWVTGEYENRPGAVHLTLYRSDLPPAVSEPRKHPAGDGPQPDGWELRPAVRADG